MECQSSHILQGDRGHKGLKGLKGATGHKVKTTAAQPHFLIKVKKYTSSSVYEVYLSWNIFLFSKYTNINVQKAY